MGLSSRVPLSQLTKKTLGFVKTFKDERWKGKRRDRVDPVLTGHAQKAYRPPQRTKLEALNTMNGRIHALCETYARSLMNCHRPLGLHVYRA